MKPGYNVTEAISFLVLILYNVDPISDSTTFQLVKVRLESSQSYIGLLFNYKFNVLDINECASSQCDLASTECINNPGAFTCKCKPGFAPTMECRPIGDLGLINGGIPDESITVSSSENGYTRTVSNYLRILH